MDIAILPGAYETLMKAALDALPAEGFGALIGRSGTGMGTLGVIEEVAPVALIPVQAGLAPDMQQWHALEERLGNVLAGGENPQIILGWFYTDSAIGIFKPRTNVVQVADMLGTNGSLLLIVNPVARQGGFYAKMGDRFAPAGDFHEVLSGEGATPVIPWTGEIQGVEEWLGDSYTTFAYSTGNIEDYELPPNVPRRGSRFSAMGSTGVPAQLGPQVPAATSPGALDSEEEANQAAGATNGAIKSAEEPASTTNSDNDTAGTPAAHKRGGPVTTPLPPLANSDLPLAPLNESRADGNNGGPKAVDGPVKSSGRWWLPVVGAVLGIALAGILSIAMVTEFLGPNRLHPRTTDQPPPTQTASTVGRGPAPQTATALAASLAPSATAGLTAQPTQTALPVVAATTTPPPTSTTTRIDTPTTTTTPRAASVPTSSPPTPSVTPSPVSITYVVQPVIR